VTPEELLRGAAHLLEKGAIASPEPTSIQRAAAVLARQALEETIAERLRPHGLDPSEASFSAQFLCLQGTMANKALAREAAALWASLSSLTHHSGQELSPTDRDLTALIERTRRVLAELG